MTSREGEASQARILMALMDGRALSPRELARAAGMAGAGADRCLADLTEAGALVRLGRGKHRYYRLASPEVGEKLERGMLGTSEEGVRMGRPRPVVTGPRDPALRRARTCYGHLAGEIGVAITATMLARGEIVFADDAGILTQRGQACLAGLGVSLDAARGSVPRRGGRRAFCHPCLDWSERRPHVGGAVGAAMCRAWFARGWIRRIEGSRAVSLTESGWKALGAAFALRA